MLGNDAPAYLLNGIRFEARDNLASAYGMSANLLLFNYRGDLVGSQPVKWPDNLCWVASKKELDSSEWINREYQMRKFCFKPDADRFLLNQMKILAPIYEGCASKTCLWLSLAMLKAWSEFVDTIKKNGVIVQVEPDSEPVVLGGNVRWINSEFRDGHFSLSLYLGGGFKKSKARALLTGRRFLENFHGHYWDFENLPEKTFYFVETYQNLYSFIDENAKDSKHSSALLWIEDKLPLDVSESNLESELAKAKAYIEKLKKRGEQELAIKGEKK